MIRKPPYALRSCYYARVLFYFAVARGAARRHITFDALRALLAAAASRIFAALKRAGDAYMRSFGCFTRSALQRAAAMPASAFAVRFYVRAAFACMPRQRAFTQACRARFARRFRA